MKTYRESEIQLQAFLTSVINGCQWLPSYFDALLEGNETTVTTGQEDGRVPELIWTTTKNKNPLSCFISHPVHRPITIPTDLSQLHQHYRVIHKNAISKLLNEGRKLKKQAEKLTENVLSHKSYYMNIQSSCTLITKELTESNFTHINRNIKAKLKHTTCSTFHCFLQPPPSDVKTTDIPTTVTELCESHLH